MNHKLGVVCVAILIAGGLVSYVWVLNNPPINSRSHKTVAKTEISQNAANRFKSAAVKLFDSSDSSEKLQSLQDAFHGFVTDSEIHRAHKIQVLLKLLASRTGIQALYVLDYLAELHPVEYASDLIRLFENSTSSELRSRIVSTLREALFAGSTRLDSARPLSPDFQLGEVAIIQFMHALALANEGEFSRYAVLNVTPLLPRDLQDQVIATLDSARRTELSIAPHDFGGLLFELAVANADERSITRFLNAVDAMVLFREPEFLEQVRVMLEQIKDDPRLRSLMEEVRTRTKNEG
jgi:hypothetical protein